MPYTNNNQINELNRKYKREDINDDLFKCYQKICKGDNIDQVIKSHKKFINGIGLPGKKNNVYKTVTLLEHYRNTRNNTMATMVLSNSVNNIRGLAP